MSLTGVPNKFKEEKHSGGDVLSVSGIPKADYQKVQRALAESQDMCAAIKEQYSDLLDASAAFEPYFEMKKDELLEACETAKCGDTLDSNPSYQELLGVLFVNHFKED